MRKFPAFIILFGAWYFAGMNMQPTVLAAVVCASAIAVIAFIFSRIIGRKADVHIPSQNSLILKDTEAPLELTAKNKSSLPINRFSVIIEMKYLTSEKGSIKKLNGSASGISQGNTQAMFYYTAPYCGLINVRLKKIRVYDYLGFFSNSKKLNGKPYEIFVLPKPKEINLLMPPFGTYTSNPVTDSSSDKSGDDHSEIRLLREYREGDLMRHIHRNLSAKTDKLWIKEYNKENDYIFDLIADTSDTELTTELLDSLYELIFSITAALIEKDVIIKLHWFDKKAGGMRNREISDRQTLYEAATQIYKSDMKCSGDEFSCGINIHNNSGMVINAKLEWYFNGEHIYSFNQGNVENELMYNVFDLRR